MLVNGLAGWLADGPSSPFDSGIDSGAMVSVAGSIEVANEVVASGAVVEVVEGALATVEVVEPMGSETFLYLTTGKHPFIAKVDVHVELKINAEVPLIVNMARAHFFQKNDETTIV